LAQVNFWRELNSELAHINAQLRAPAAQTSMALLKQAKRYWATMAFDTDTVGVKRAAELAQAYAPLTEYRRLLLLLLFIVVDGVGVGVDVCLIVIEYCVLDKFSSQLPLAPLRQAPTVAALRQAVADVFSHLQRASQVIFLIMIVVILIVHLGFIISCRTSFAIVRYIYIHGFLCFSLLNSIIFV
jgi:hypothetical protein